MNQQSDEEDFDSEGEPDEEVLQVVADLARRRAELQGYEMEDHDQRGPIIQQPPVPDIENDSDEELAGLNASPSPPPNDRQPTPPDDYDPVNPPMPRAIRRPGRPPIVQRDHPRNPLIEPPLIMEYIEQFDVPNMPPHPRAEMYPRNWTYGMVAYAEDPYWTQRIVPLPPGVRVPPRPADYMDLNNIENPPLPRREYNPQPGNPPIPIRPEVIEIWNQNFEQIYERVLEERQENRSPDTE